MESYMCNPGSEELVTMHHPYVQVLGLQGAANVVTV